MAVQIEPEYASAITIIIVTDVDNVKHQTLLILPMRLAFS